MEVAAATEELSVEEVGEVVAKQEEQEEAAETEATTEVESSPETEAAPKEEAAATEETAEEVIIRNDNEFSNSHVCKTVLKSNLNMMENEKIRFPTFPIISDLRGQHFILIHNIQNFSFANMIYDKKTSRHQRRWQLTRPRLPPKRRARRSETKDNRYLFAL